MKEKEMAKVGEWIAQAIKEVKDARLPKEVKERNSYISKFKTGLSRSKNLKQIREEIQTFTKRFPLPGEKKS
jgi:glycine/serine hydroxymethyltransferase